IPQLIAALKVDKETNMGLVSDIEQALRKVGQLKINYTTKKGSGLK
ncbi:MAG: biopolymer transporter ExbD, partial [Olleya sp.]